jgi:hypothetical protein
MCGDCFKQAIVDAVNFLMMFLEDIFALSDEVSQKEILLGLERGEFELDKDRGIKIGSAKLN